MKKFVGVALCLLILITSQIAFASEEKFEFDASLYREIKIIYTEGPMIPQNYNYSTTDVNEIKLLTDAINDINCKPSLNYGGTNDGTYMYVCFDNEHVVYFDVNFGNCIIGEKNYEFDKDDFVFVKNLVYDLKTKNDIKLFLNNERLKPDVSPILINERTLVSVRALGESLGADVIWHSENNSVELIKDDDSLVFFIDEDYIIENDERKEIDVGCRLINHTTMVPVRALSEFFGCTVNWKDNSVYIIP